MIRLAMVSKHAPLLGTLNHRPAGTGDSRQRVHSEGYECDGDRYYDERPQRLPILFIPHVVPH